MSEAQESRAAEAILAAVKEVEAEAPGGAEALYMAAMLADSPLPYDFALSIDGTAHNPALINPAAAFFAATVTMDSLVTHELVVTDADSQIFQIKPEVKSVLRDAMDTTETIEWAGRAIYGINLSLPDADPSSWQTVSWLMPHINACRELIKTLNIRTAAANRVLHQTGFALYHQNRFAEAADLLEAALMVDIDLKGDRHPDIVADLEGLGMVHWAGDNLPAAEDAFARCIELQKEIMTEDNPAMAPILNSLAVVRQSRGDMEKAESTFMECLRLLEHHHGPDDPTTASCLSNMALLYEAMDRPAEAANMVRRSLGINIAAYGPDHPEVGADNNTLGLLFERLDDPDRAEAHFLASLDIRERALGTEHPDTAQTMCNLGLLIQDQPRRLDEAFDYFDNGLAAYEASLGKDHPLMESALENFIRLLEKIQTVPSNRLLRERAHARLKAIVEKAE